MSILVIEDSQERIAFFKEFIERMYPNHKFHYVDNKFDAINAFKNIEFDIAFFDHDINPSWYLEEESTEHLNETGSGVATVILWNDGYKLPKLVIVHSENPVGAENIASKFHSAKIPCKVYPFSNIMFDIAFACENNNSVDNFFGAK